MSDNKMENVSIKERAKQLKAVRSILRGEEVQKTVMVGYEGKKQKQGDIESPLTSIMQKVRMPWFCPECKKVMKSRLDDKFWRTMGHCFNCQVEIENKKRIEGTYEEWAQQKVLKNKVSFIKNALEEIDGFINTPLPVFWNQTAADGETMDKEEWTADMTALKEKGEDAKKMWTDELKKTEKELNSLFIDGELHDKN